MKKRNLNPQMWIIATLILIFIGVIWYGGTAGWFKSIFNQAPAPYTPAPEKIIKEYLTYNVQLSVTPSQICVGDAVTGTITSNIYNGVCSIFINNGAGYVFFANVNLDRSGSFSQTETISVAGTALFQAVCCDSSGNCKLSSTSSLISRVCDSDGDGNPDDTDPDDDNDGFSDEEEDEAGTDPLNPDSHPTVTDPCPTYCQGLDYATGRFVTNPSACMPPEVPFVYPPASGYCCCVPKSQPQGTYTCGQGTDSQCGGTCPLKYPYCVEVYTEMYVYSCMCVDSLGESGNIAPDWKPDGSMYNEHQAVKPEDCIDYDGGAKPFMASYVTYGGNTYSDACHAGSTSYSVDEYICRNDAPLKKEILCPYSDCINGKCTTGTTTVYEECVKLGYLNGGTCVSGDSPCTSVPSLDTACGEWYPLNHAICCS